MLALSQAHTNTLSHKSERVSAQEHLTYLHLNVLYRQTYPVKEVQAVCATQQCALTK